MTSRCGMEVPFALCETPCFFPNPLVERMGEDGKALIRQLVGESRVSGALRGFDSRKFRVPNESPHPMFIQVDFGLVRDSAGELQPKLVEFTGLPFPLCVPARLAQAYIDVFWTRSDAPLLFEWLDSLLISDFCRTRLSRGTIRRMWC